MAATKALTRVTLRGLLRTASKYEAVAAPLPTELASLIVPGASICEAVKSQFRLHKDAPPAAASALLDKALTSLALANKHLALLDKQVDSKPAEVSFSVGQVFRHKIFGYRAVIIGWDERCKASNKWVAATGTAKLPHGTDQPFYYCLVDIRDRPSPQISYVAQDSIDLMTPTGEESAADHANPLERMVIHPLLAKHFDEFRVAEGFYVPTARVMEEYPDETPSIVRTMRANASATDSDSDGEDSDSDRSQRANNLV